MTFIQSKFGLEWSQYTRGNWRYCFYVNYLSNLYLEGNRTTPANIETSCNLILKEKRETVLHRLIKQAPMEDKVHRRHPKGTGSISLGLSSLHSGSLQIMSSRELLAVSQPAPNWISPLDSLFSCRQCTAAYCADSPWEMAGPPQNLWLQIVGWNNCQRGAAWSLHGPSKQRKNGKGTTATCHGGNPLASCWAAALLLLLGQIQQQEKPRPSCSPRRNDCMRTLPADIRQTLSHRGLLQPESRAFQEAPFQLFWTLLTAPPPALPAPFEHQGMSWGNKRTWTSIAFIGA